MFPSRIDRLKYLAAPVDHRLEISVEMRPTVLTSLDPWVALESTADDDLPGVDAEDAFGDMYDL
ncbi:MAG: hypothetical protein NVSMB14_00340 [Isosphaeraceae bacterium]